MESNGTGRGIGDGEPRPGAPADAVMAWAQRVILDPTATDDAARAAVARMERMAAGGDRDAKAMLNGLRGTMEARAIPPIPDLPRRGTRPEKKIS